MNIKQFSALIFAAILGASIAIGAFVLIQPQQQERAQADQPQRVQVANTSQVNTPFDFVDAAAKTTPAVVHIRSTVTSKKRDGEMENPFEYFFGNPGGRGERSGTGSGVLIADDGYIITNNHVIENATEIEVTLSDQREYKAKLIGTDKNTDIAVIKIEGNGFPTLKYADSDQTLVGQWVLAIGNPLDLASTVTAGIISAKGRNINLLRREYGIESFIQTDAAVNPGNSGGALTNTDGDLIGINTAIASQTGMFAGYSFAVPSNLVRKVVDDIIQYGEFKRGFLGVKIQDFDEDDAAELGVSFTEGVLLLSVESASPAEMAGLLPDDIVTHIDSKRIRTTSQLQEVIAIRRPGDKVNIDILRKGKAESITVMLREINE